MCCANIIWRHFNNHLSSDIFSFFSFDRYLILHRRENKWISLYNLTLHGMFSYDPFLSCECKKYKSTFLNNYKHKLMLWTGLTSFSFLQILLGQDSTKKQLSNIWIWHKFWSDDEEKRPLHIQHLIFISSND